MLELLNDPTWIRFIGDRGVPHRRAGPLLHRERLHPKLRPSRLRFILVRLTATSTPLGVCGLYQRDYLPGPDVGFAFLPASTGQGFAHEATSAIMAHGRTALHLNRFLAICSPDNAASVKLLGKLGLRFDRTIRAPGGNEDLSLFTTDPTPAVAT